MTPSPLWGEGRGEGSFNPQRREKLLANAVDIFHHVVIPEPNNDESIRFKKTIPLFVMIIVAVLPTVDLDDPMCIQAYKIDDVFSDWKLPPELEAFEAAIPQAQP